jgi:hypothetical protein
MVISMENVDSSAPLLRLIPQAFGCLEIMQVSQQEEVAIRRHACKRRLGTGLVRAVVGDDMGSRFARDAGYGGTDALGGAGDQDGLAVQVQREGSDNQAKPASTGSNSPLMPLDISLARKSAALATSSAVASLCTAFSDARAAKAWRSHRPALCARVRTRSNKASGAIGLGRCR